MAVTEKAQGGSAAGRRWFFGTNVTILVLLVLFVTIAVNWVGHRRSVRADLSGGFSSHRLSERTKRIIERTEGDLRITTVYTSDEPEQDRKKYFPNLRDLCEEIRQSNKKIKVEHLHSGNERAELRDRVQGKFGSAAQKHEEAVTLAKSTWEELATTLAPLRQEIEGVLRDENGWLGGFTVLARFFSALQADLQNIEETQREVNDLVQGEGIPRYQEANTKIKDANDDLKKHLEDLQDWLEKMNGLAEVLADPNSEFATRTREELAVLDKLLKHLARTAGDPEDPSVPDDPKPVLQDFAKAANALASWLVDESGRVDAFVKANPAIENHPQWLVGIRQGPLLIKMPLSLLLGQTAESLSGNAQALRQVLAQEQRQDQLQHYVRQIRKIAPQVGQQLAVFTSNILAILDEGSRIDPASKELLDRGSSGELFGEVLHKLEEVSTKIDDLPEIELDDIAERLQEENIIVIESGDDVRVLTFDDAWPIADPLAGRLRMGDEDAPQRRVFDGDSAISGALLSTRTDKPFATVILVGYETEPPPQMRQFGQRGNTGRIPLAQLSALKEKLEQANFAVKEWNLGAEGDDEKPEPEEGTEPIYAFLPPASTPPPNPMMRQPPPKSFGEPELKKVREVLAGGAPAIFLAAWEPPRMMGMFAPPMPTPYGYDQLLKDDWGIEVHTAYRLLRGVPDRKEVDRYAIDVAQISHMQLSSFTHHPIGQPLKARRVLMTDVCPVTRAKDPATQAEKIPEGVTIISVLEVPEGTRDLWAESNDGIRRISNVLQSGERRGQFTKDPKTSWDPAFSVVLAAEKTIETKTEKPTEDTETDETADTTETTTSRVVVMGTGLSLADFYMTRRVPRFEGKRARLVTDPPPTENAELLINVAYWLGGREDLIAAGPAEVRLIPAIEPASKTNARLISFGWAFLVLIVGLVMMMIRRT